ncbi:TPA: hypothetical protein N0F65_002151 [Lagenidium giganteum]|uniref:NADP-dependent oxidoreductase domain-containing protein n=1 Tax=Lagenidium giganteum TaxID=4803 RepID=A0AAV2YPR9_9STRA|nr:TPA: hypothetical protein N0F65_002151 [Lagenidium giganteum]
MSAPAASTLTKQDYAPAYTKGRKPGKMNSDIHVDDAYAILKHAYESGINLIDNAEGYGDGRAEEIMGQTVRRGITDGVWQRDDLVLTTKLFTGTKQGPNAQGLSRKHIVEGMQASLERMGLKYVDVVFCHRPDPRTPIEETVRAMNFLIDQGWAFYWGTSEWTSHDLLKACEVADRLGLIRPVVEQPQYNMFERSRVEFDYLNLYKKYGLGLTIWSPLAMGILTGKYNDGIPEGSRFQNTFFKSVVPDFAEKVKKAQQLKLVADKIGCTGCHSTTCFLSNNQRTTIRIMSTPATSSASTKFNFVPAYAKGPKPSKMKYRYLGDTGLLVSVLSYGAMTFSYNVEVDEAYAIMKHAYEAGVNFIDNAEAYGDGRAEEIMGQAVQRGIADGVWQRDDLVLTTKLFSGYKQGPNAQGLSRKHIVEGMQASLERMGLKYVYVVFCHRPDPRTPIEETRSTHAHRRDRACDELPHRPRLGVLLGNQRVDVARLAQGVRSGRSSGLDPSYNLLERSRVEFDYLNLYKKYGLGLTIWSPLAMGVLTGKYNDGIPEGTRLNNPLLRAFVTGLDQKVSKVKQLQLVADKVGCSMAQLAIAWCASNPNVSTVMLGASNIKQLDENLKALDFVHQITPEIKAEIDAIIQFTPVVVTNDPRFVQLRDMYLK